ncbi:CDP-diacylglycerol--serine O-phosphatidyltransferase [Prevotella intermedia]|uniref:CDP-diacylglycerol--serine O-phosphatidyltransferase n=1 Tax=Prevotella intermedia TaxID=28131 RepID=UPI00077DFAC2|nr:CDP-diacylglycerol--serine O-phosphatidyltransferase [Prevotella intermedia]
MAIKKHVPNTITCCNLVSGCVAIAYAFSGNIELSFTWIIIGAVFDFFDGMSARLLNVSSPIGKELDSLADVVTFGVAPSTILFSELSVMSYPTILEPLRSILPFTAYIMAAFSALRLAKFNLDERQTLGFIGLPTPANALFWGSLIIGAGKWLETTPLMVLFLLGGILISSWLMVSEIPMFALKFKEWGWKGNQVKYIFLLTCIPLLAIFGLTGLAIIIAWYVIISYIIKK